MDEWTDGWTCVILGNMSVYYRCMTFLPDMVMVMVSDLDRYRSVSSTSMRSKFDMF